MINGHHNNELRECKNKIERLHEPQNTWDEYVNSKMILGNEYKERDKARKENMKK